MERPSDQDLGDQHGHHWEKETGGDHAVGGDGSTKAPADSIDTVADGLIVDECEQRVANLHEGTDPHTKDG